MKQLIINVVCLACVSALAESYPTLKDGYGWTCNIVFSNKTVTTSAYSVANANFSSDKHGRYIYLPYGNFGGSAGDNWYSNSTATKVLYFTLQNSDPSYFSKTFRWYVGKFSFAAITATPMTISYCVSNVLYGFPGTELLASTTDAATNSYRTGRAEIEAGEEYTDILVEGFTTQSEVAIVFYPPQPTNVANGAVNAKLYIHHESGY